MIKAIIFDMDGVLVNSENLKAESWKMVLSDYGVDSGDKWYKRNIGNSRENLAKMAINEFSLNAEWKELFDKKQTYYFEMLKTKTEPIESSITFLKSIPKDKFKIAVNSSINKEVINHQMKALGIFHLFDAITSGLDEVENDKPHPDIYLLSVKKLGLTPEECIAIEDSSPGVSSVKSAGIKCIGFRNENSGSQDLSKADLIISDLREVDINNLDI